MRTAQLIHPAVALALAATLGCSRAETSQQTQRAADEVKTVAARAGDKLSDGWLTTRIQAQYFADDQIKARYVDVSTHDKVVTIKGYVESPAARERALQIARSTDGVRQVNDQILIGQSPRAFEPPLPVPNQEPVATSGVTPPSASTTAPIDDGQLTSSIQAKYFLDPTIKGRRVEVDARGGVVTLSGEVASEGERAQALLLARSTQGVQRVEDHLTVNAGADPAAPNPQVSAPLPSDDATVAGTIKSQFSADPQLTVVDVTVQEGVAQLQGTVPSTAARQKAVDLARNTDGVTQVVDRLRIRR